MKKYLFLIKNSFLENNLHLAGTIALFIEPIFELIGFVFLYSYLSHGFANLSKEIIVYFVSVFTISSINPRGLMSFVKKDFKEERFLNINQRPINPFLYYYAQNIGRNLINFVTAIILGLFVLIYYSYPMVYILIFIPAAIMANLLLNLIYFWICVLRFYLKYFSNSLFNVIIEFLSGKMVPISYFPAGFLFTLKLFPFIYTNGLIARNISQYNIKGILISVLVVFIWFVLIHSLALRSWFKGSEWYQENM